KADDPAAVRQIWEICQTALAACGQHALHPQGLAGRCGYEAWVRGTNAEHMATCDDPDCDWRICRLARGGTLEEIRADIEATRPELLARMQAKIQAKRKAKQRTVGPIKELKCRK